MRLERRTAPRTRSVALSSQHSLTGGPEASIADSIACQKDTIPMTQIGTGNSSSSVSPLSLLFVSYRSPEKTLWGSLANPGPTRASVQNLNLTVLNPITTIITIAYYFHYSYYYELIVLERKPELEPSQRFEDISSAASVEAPSHLFHNGGGFGVMGGLAQHFHGEYARETLLFPHMFDRVGVPPQRSCQNRCSLF